MADNKFDKLGKTVILSVVLGFLLLLVFVAFFFDAPIYIVVLSFLPSVLVMAITIFMVEAFSHKIAALAWFMPFILSLMFYFLSPYIDLLSPVNINVITALNILLSFSLVALVNLIVVLRHEHFIE